MKKHQANANDSHLPQKTEKRRWYQLDQEMCHRFPQLRVNATKPTKKHIASHVARSCRLERPSTVQSWGPLGRGQGSTSRISDRLFALAFSVSAFSSLFFAIPTIPILLISLSE
jgi:hypothetical protein